MSQKAMAATILAGMLANSDNEFSGMEDQELVDIAWDFASRIMRKGVRP